MKKILVSSFDMSIGGVERSLLSLLENFDYSSYDVDLMLYRHNGEFLPMLPKGHNLLKEIPQYSTFRKSIAEVLKEKHFLIAVARLMAKYFGKIMARCKGLKEQGLVSMQLGWVFALPFLPKLEKEYDIAISYLWPHYFVAEKVSAKKKIAWIHTDYSSLSIDNKLDEKMWEKYDWIIAVSESCRQSFLNKYPKLADRTTVIENIISPEFIGAMAQEDVSKEIADGNNIKLVTVARLSYAKGIDDAVRACRILLDQGYRITWYVVGYGCEEKSIRSLISELNLDKNFILLGKKLNPYPYVKACNIYVQPSRYEGKAVTVTEAQILGKPVLIANYNTASSQVKDGFDGIITDVGIEGIVAGVKRLINNPELMKSLEYNTSCKDYINNVEIRKLYKLIQTKGGEQDEYSPKQCENGKSAI